jgi:ubiquinone/menaquinone biosynthesis C-methylase UbiE
MSGSDQRSATILDWQLHALDPAGAPAGRPQVHTTVGLGPAARQAIAGIPAGTKVVLGVEIGVDGAIAGVAVPPEFAAAAREAGLRLRVDLVADGYDRRHVDFSKIHGVREDDLQVLAQTLGLRQGMKVLDLGCGYGEVSANILADADRRGIGIDLSLCDLHEAQIRNVPQVIRSRARQIVIGDARSLPFAHAEFDAVVMKMVLHEVPMWDQPTVCEEVFRVLRPGGVFVVWGVMPADGEMQDIFNKIMQLKNALASYESLVRDRYIFRLDQLLRMLTQAGFADARERRQVHFRQSTLARRDSELGGSNEQLARLNAYCRALISPDLAKRLDLTDSGDDIQFTVSYYIVSGHRPQ